MVFKIHFYLINFFRAYFLVKCHPNLPKYNKLNAGVMQISKSGTAWYQAAWYQAAAWSIRHMPDQIRRQPDRSGCCRIKIRQLPDRSGTCQIKIRQQPDRSGCCLIKMRQLPNQSGTCQIKIRRQPDWSGCCLIKIRQLPDRSGPWFVRSLPSGKSEYPWDHPRVNFSRQPLQTFCYLYQTLHCCIWDGYNITQFEGRVISLSQARVQARLKPEGVGPVVNRPSTNKLHHFVQ